MEDKEEVYRTTRREKTRGHNTPHGGGNRKEKVDGSFLLGAGRSSNFGVPK